mmetsp:Transcript_21228/g.49193  ORF Transcript_21228/g.49193 Transcript_21228/m.49193 type:complete len:627 (-) Transcript_21228:85-1965(-)
MTSAGSASAMAPENANGSGRDDGSKGSRVEEAASARGTSVAQQQLALGDPIDPPSFGPLQACHMGPLRGSFWFTEAEKREVEQRLQKWMHLLSLEGMVMRIEPVPEDEIPAVGSTAPASPADASASGVRASSDVKAQQPAGRGAARGRGKGRGRGAAAAATSPARGTAKAAGTPLRRSARERKLVEPYPAFRPEVRRAPERSRSSAQPEKKPAQGKQVRKHDAKEPAAKAKRGGAGRAKVASPEDDDDSEQGLCSSDEESGLELDEDSESPFSEFHKEEKKQNKAGKSKKAAGAADRGKKRRKAEEESSAEKSPPPKKARRERGHRQRPAKEDAPLPKRRQTKGKQKEPAAAAPMEPPVDVPAPAPKRRGLRNVSVPDSRPEPEALKLDDKKTLQEKMDRLPDEQLDRVFEYLGFGSMDDGTSLTLELELMEHAHRVGLQQLVDRELAIASQALPAASQEVSRPPESPAFPSFDLGETPRSPAPVEQVVPDPAAEAAPLSAAAANPPALQEDSAAADEQEEGDDLDVIRKRRPIWEDYSAREVFRLSQAKEASGSQCGGSQCGSTPALTPGGGDPLADGTAMPEVSLPPAASPTPLAKMPPTPKDDSMMNNAAEVLELLGDTPNGI